MKIALIDLKRQYETIREEADAQILEVLHSANYIMGNHVKTFEREFAEYIGVQHAISVANGTDALVMALKALGIGEGDEVITTTFTFFATAESISFVGATPVFVDVEKDSYNMDPTKIEAAITEKTKAIMPVHIFGYACDMDKINKIAKAHGLYVIEDCAQASGTMYKGKKVGALSDIATFSFFPTKNLGCAGDGGMIVTDSDDLACILKAYRVHGSGENGQRAYNLIHGIEDEITVDQSTDNTVYNPLKYYNYLVGHNSRLDEVQAALLRVKLRKLDEWNMRRSEIAEIYNAELAETAYVTPYRDAHTEHIYHMYILQTEERLKVLEELAAREIATGVYYPVPMHLQKVYRDLGYKEGDFPVAEYLSERTFAIPMFAELMDDEIEYIVECLKEIR